MGEGSLRTVGTALLAMAVLCACGPFPGDSSAAGASSRSQANQGGETNPTVYTDARFHYQITGPGPLKALPDGTATFAGEDERLEVAVVTGSRAADPAALAQSDLNGLRSSAPDFQALVQPVTVTLGGQGVIKFTYSFTGSGHTGKTIKFFNVRYYIAKNESTLAVISYRDSATEFDAQEADGFASSFRWQ